MHISLRYTYSSSSHTLSLLSISLYFIILIILFILSIPLYTLFCHICTIEVKDREEFCLRVDTTRDAVCYILEIDTTDLAPAGSPTGAAVHCSDASCYFLTALHCDDRYLR